MIELTQEQKTRIINKAQVEILESSVLTKKQKFLLISYLVLAGISVIPTFEYGAGFSQDFTLAMEPQLSNSTGTLNAIRLPFATTSGVVNGIINTRSFYFAFAVIGAELLNIYDTTENGPLLKAMLTFVAKLGFISAAAVPNWQIVKDGAHSAHVNWSDGLMKTIQITVCAGAAALVFRGIEGVINNFTYSRYARIFPPLREQQDKAAYIKLQLLRKLVPHLGDDQLKELSKGYRYQGPAFVTQFLIKIVFFVAPALFYTYAAYWGSSDEAMVNFLAMENNPSFWSNAFRYFVDTAATVGRGMVLANVATLIADNLLNCRAYDKLTNKFLPITATDIAINTIVTMIMAVSLTGAMGLVYEYLFHESGNLSDLIGSVAIALLGAGAINFGDVKALLNGIWNGKTLLCGDSCAPLPEISDERVAAEIISWHPKKVLKETDAVLASRVGFYSSRPLQPMNEETRLLSDGPSANPIYSMNV